MPFSAPSFQTRAYYFVKPFIPRRVRWGLRRSLARKILRNCAEIWPINEAAGGVPDAWPGWPEGKRFAVVLTHDVESQAGLNQVRPLAELEMELGFRSAFNFIPEGEYRVPEELREWLVDNGFEVGIHDLHHDGNLYSSREAFLRKAARINRYLDEWKASGFRSGFMLRRLGWLHDLDILYDSSTFDTDPFEPQPDGACTIFPFRVPEPEGREGSGYIELPYTLPQDSTLYLLLSEQTPEIWTRKLNWIAEQGGLALVNVHPDYLAFNGESTGEHTYPVAMYRELLEELKETHQENYWHRLPKEVATFADQALPAEATAPAARLCKETTPKPKIWFDLDNTPHVPFFGPIIEELKARGYPVVVTARDAFQVCELAAQKGLTYTKIGRHHGRHLVCKIAGLVSRGLRLVPFAYREVPDLAVSHGSRAQLLVCRFLGIPSLELTDYEHAQSGGLLKPTWLMGPEYLSETRLARHKGHFQSYPGLKEDVYAWRLSPDPGIRDDLGLGEVDALVTVRPPATEAHYHDPEGEEFFERFMDRAVQTPDTKVVLLPRNAVQESALREQFPRWFRNDRTIVPTRALDGMALIASSDLVVSGGGTMCREAAALGVPSYSVFRGEAGAVDRQLVSEGRLVMVESRDEVDSRIVIRKREPASAVPRRSKRTLNTIIKAIIDYATR